MMMTMRMTMKTMWTTIADDDDDDENDGKD
jgi:hypothetical protein